MFGHVKLFRFVLLSLTALTLSGCAGQHDILSGLSENDANQVIVVLQSQDIVADKTAVPGRTITFAIKVSDSDAKRALKILVDNKLPKVTSAGLAQVYPLGGGGLIPSATQEKAQLMMALQGEIENMLLVLPGIVQARVVVVLPDSNIIRDPDAPPPQSTASVAVVFNPIDDAGKASVTSDDVRFLIASAIPDLLPANVTVVMASNHPMKLIDSQKTATKSITSASPKLLATENTHSAYGVASPPSQASESRNSSTSKTPETAAATTDPAEADKQEFLLMLLGGIAAAGLLFGLIGLWRAIALRAKMRRLEQANAEAA